MVITLMYGLHLLFRYHKQILLLSIVDVYDIYLINCGMLAPASLHKGTP